MIVWVTLVEYRHWHAAGGEKQLQHLSRRCVPPEVETDKLKDIDAGDSTKLQGELDGRSTVMQAKLDDDAVDRPMQCLT